MKRPRSHQIDELAQRVLKFALPPVWVVNDHTNDYGKDYLIEIADDDGELMGGSFFVQLKGQEEVSVNEDEGVAKFSLKSRYAKYYCDKVRDVPLFLVLVDVTTSEGWWLFLQGALRSDSSWRYADSRTLRIPLDNRLSNIEELRLAVAGSKDWMRRNYPDFRTPFLRQCFDFLDVELGLPEAHIADNGMVEQMNMAYFHEFPCGIPEYNASAETWLFHDCGDDDPANLMLDVYSDGTFTISPGDDDGVFLDVPIRNPEEIGEVLYLAEELAESDMQARSESEIPLSSAFGELSFIIPVYERYLLATPSDVASLNADIGQTIDALLNPDSQDSWDHLVKIGFSGWDQWCRDHHRELSRSNLRPPDSDTLVYSYQTGLVTFRRWLAFGVHPYRDVSLAVAFSRAPGSTSSMFLCDHFSGTTTSKTLIDGLQKHWRAFDDYARNKTVSVPVTVLEQIRISVEERIKSRSQRY